MSKGGLSISIVFLLLLVIGIYGVYSIPYILVSQVFGFEEKYLLVPLFIFSFTYAYYSSFGGQEKNALWKNLLAFVLASVMIGMMTFLSFQGISMLINKNLGNQKNYFLRGTIFKLNYPVEKKIGNKYSIFIKRDFEKDTVEMNVPTNKYKVGQSISKNMKMGSLGFIYSNQ
jgi:hypothetical protein